MSAENMELDHPKSIWTWRWSNRGRGKATLYLPYLQEIKKVRGGYSFRYNGGEVVFRLEDVESILLYGASGDLPVSFLDDLNKHRVSLIIHRRNMSMPYAFVPSIGSDRRDILTKQILTREDSKKKSYIARTLVRERLDSMSWLCDWPGKDRVSLRQSRSVAEIRNMEAKHTKRYWSGYYASIGLDGINRREHHPVNTAMDACSVFLGSIILRWLIYHRFSVSHGYLHEPTSYPSLIYDLLEPYRYWMEMAVAVAWKVNGENEIVSRSMAQLSEILDVEVYVPATQQMASRKNLLHGIVLALLDYMDGDGGKGNRFVVPVEGTKGKGRPPKVGYRIPGGK